MVAEGLTHWRSGRLGDWLFHNLTRLFAVFTLLMLVGTLASLLHGAMPSIKEFGWSFLWTGEWNPPVDRFGAMIPIYGTLVTSLIALAIAVPVSFGIALFLTEMAPG